MVMRSVHQLSRILLTCPAQVHFHLLICLVTSVAFVFYLCQMFVFLSRYVNILLSTFVCVAATLFFAWMVSVRVYALYVIACSSVTLDDVAVLGGYCPSHRDSLHLLFFSFLSLMLYLSPR